MIEIALNSIEKYYGANQVLKGLSLEIQKGERVGLLGKNGAGKTTVFKIIAGIEKQDAGARMVRKDTVIGMLDQLPQYPGDCTAEHVLYSAFESLHELKVKMVELEKLMGAGAADVHILSSYGKLQQAFEAMDGYTTEESIDRVCTGLKIDRDMRDKLFSNLSGGEKTRVVLGRLILQNPDIILLDEPTNHLDLSSIEWLEDYLQQFKGTAVIISHDRYFLDTIVKRIIEVADGKAEVYEGNYSYYAVEKDKRYQLQLEKYEQEQKKIKQLESAAKRMHEWAKNADNPHMHRRAFSIEKRIERMEKTDRPVHESSMKSHFNEYGFSGRDVVVFSSISKVFGERNILNNIDFIVQRGERVAILGSNGTGKSTLVKVITGEIKADKGSCRVGESIKYAYLPQHIIFENPDATMLEMVRNELEISEGSARELLARFKFNKEDVHKRVKNLSGGEKSRLRLCIQMQSNANLLLLDEPTNHLDIHSREWLENALSEFGGTIIFVSHDRYFINRFATRVSELANGKIMDYYGDYEFYKVRKLEVLKAKESEKRMNTKTAIRDVKPKRDSYKEKDKATSDKRAEVHREKLENNILVLEARLSDINMEMQNSDDDYLRLDTLYKQKTELEEKIQELYNQWLSDN